MSSSSSSYSIQQNPKKKQKSLKSSGRAPLSELVEYFPIDAALNLFREYLLEVLDLNVSQKMYLFMVLTSYMLLVTNT